MAAAGFDLDVRITDIGGTQMAAKIDGTFVIDCKLELSFEAIAFGRIGGQNIGAKLSEQAESELKSAGYDPDDVIMQLQRSLLQGDLTLPEGLSRETFADGSITPPPAAGGDHGISDNNNNDSSGNRAGNTAPHTS